ncbi:hypothetical protein NDN08_006956 [Rhodosorus marinus]|uniref:Calmodulin n=1 Tax=Rhodosorus marinus TaxID=101924 RepID=A0AAV8UJ43_9RHOD|nr:hypothetical protein NDN08_006956 [Rhodosorus marinus]
MGWRMTAGGSSSEIHLGEVACGEPGISRRIVISNDQDRVLNVQLAGDSDLLAVADRIDFEEIFEADAETADPEEAVPDPPVFGEDENLMFHEGLRDQWFTVSPHSNKLILAKFQPLSSPDSVDKQELVHFAGKIVAKEQIVESTSDENVEASEEKYVDVKGRICASIINAEVAELMFNSCEPLKKYVKDFTVRNCSEIPTIVRLRSTNIIGENGSDENPVLQYSDYETGASLAAQGARIELGNFSHKRLRVIFQPLKVGEVEYVLDINNTRNVQNTQSIRIFATVTVDTPITGLEISCGDELDFGDRYAFHPYPKKIWLRNIHDEPLAIKMSSDVPSHIAYELAMREEDESTPGQRLESISDLSPTSPASTGQSTPQVLTSSARPGDQGSSRSANGFGDNGTSTSKEENQDSGAEGTEEKWHSYKRNSIEELSLNPGQTKWLRIWFLPTVSTAEGGSGPRSTALKSGTLQNKSFRLLFRSSTHVSKTIYCRSRVCESIVKISPKEVNLGDCNVQTQSSTVVRIFNYSDLPAFINVKYVSKCVTAAVRDMVIAKRQWYDLLLNYVPRKVNPEYEKQITIVNRRNRKNDSVFVLRANVVDRNKVSVHALFYKILAPTPANEVDMGMTVEGYPAITTFEVRNITTQRLKLSFRGSAQVALFVLQSFPGMSSRPGGGGSRSASTRKNTSQSSATDQQTESDNGKVEKVVMYNTIIADLLESLKYVASIPTYFAQADAERSYMDKRLKPMVLLKQASAYGLIERTSEVSLSGEETSTLFACYTPVAHKWETGHRARFRPIEEKLYVRLVEFDETRLSSHKTREEFPLDPAQIAPRELTLSVLACRSELEVAQKVLNFGKLRLNERRAKSIVVQNKAEAPLLYGIQKSGSVASGDLRFDVGRFGVVRPYSSKEIHFVFSPSLAGFYEEVITINNFLDPRDVQSVKIKAEVLKRRNFHLEVLSKTDFGRVPSNGPSEEVLRVKITNDSDKARKFAAEVGFRSVQTEANASNEAPLPSCILYVEDQAQHLESLPQSEDIASLQMKVEAYKRKGKLAKAEKAMETIAQLKAQDAQSEESAAEVDSASEGQRLQVSKVVPVKGGEGRYLQVRIVPAEGSASKKIFFAINIYETKNKDQLEAIDCTAHIKRARAPVKSRVQEAELVGKSSPEQLLLNENNLEAIGLSTRSVELNEVVVGGESKRSSFVIRNMLLEPLEFRLIIPKHSNRGAGSSGTPESKGATFRESSSKENGLGSQQVDVSSDVEVVAFPLAGEIGVEKSITIDLEVASVSSGRHFQSVLVQCTKGEEVFKRVLQVCVNSIVKPLIEIPEADEDGALNLGQGIAHESKAFAIEKKITLRSRSPRNLWVKIRSNLSSQVFVHEEDEGSGDSLPLAPRGARAVRVRVAPNLEVEELKDGMCKSLVGGLHFVLTEHEEGNSTVLVEQTVKFSALVGMMLVDVDRAVLNLGAVSSIRAVLRDQFTITNRSKGIPAELELIPSSDRVRLSELRVSLPPESSRVLRMTLASGAVGMCVETIKVRNLDVPAVTKVVPIGAFVDPHELQVLHTLETPLRQDNLGIDDVDGVTLFVSPTEDQRKWNISFSEAVKFWLRTMEGKMRKTEFCYFTSRSRIEFASAEAMSWEQAQQRKAAPQPGFEVFSPCEMPFELGGNRDAVEVEARFVEGSVETLTLKQAQELRDHRSTEFYTYVLLCSTSRGQDGIMWGTNNWVIKALKISGLMCYSKIRVKDTQPIEFGNIGHSNGWTSMVAEAELENMTRIPTSYEVSKQPAEIEILDDTGSGEIPGGGTATIRLKLVAERLRDHAMGEVALMATVRNLRNKENSEALMLSATVTTPCLAFDKLGSGEPWELVLPPVTVPSLGTCEGWFRVTNVGEELSVLDFSLREGQAKLSNLFTITVSELSSGSPLKTTTLSSGESIAIRVMLEPNTRVSRPDSLEEILSCFPRTQTFDGSPTSESFDMDQSSSSGLGLNRFAQSSPTLLQEFESEKSVPTGEDFDDQVEEVNALYGSLEVGCIVGDLRQPGEVVNVVGQLSAGPSISVSPSMLTLFVGRSPDHQDTGTESDSEMRNIHERVLLQNLWADADVHFEAVVFGLPGSLSVVLKPTEGTVPAGGRLELQVYAKRAQDDFLVKEGSPRHATIMLRDKSRGSAPPVTVSLAVSFSKSMSRNEPISGEHSGSNKELGDMDLQTPKAPILQALFRARSQEGESGGAGMGRAPKGIDSDGVLEEHAAVFELPVSVTRKPKSVQKEMTSTEDLSHLGTLDNVIIVKGCSALPGSGLRYETDVGQVTVGKPVSPWKLTLESAEDEPVEYKVHQMHGYEADERWFSLSRNGGILEKGKVQNLEIAFSSERIGVHSTYLLIENRENSLDLKTIRVSIEVVADGSVSRISREYFSVLCDGGQQSLEYSMATFDHVYRHRSFFICNDSNYELEFLLSHDVPSWWRTEVNFSSTNATLRKVNSLWINPRQKRRIFLYFRPRLEEEDLQHLQGDLVATTIVRKFNVSINCRLVKDFQETIEITATCRPPQLKLNQTDFLFDLNLNMLNMTKSQARKTPVKSSLMSPAVHNRDSEQAIYKALIEEGSHLEKVLEVHNLFDDELHYAVRNDSLFFSSDGQLVGSLVDQNRFAKLTLKLRVSRLLERLAFLVKEKYVEEHIAVYNKRLPEEYYWVRLRISFGGASEFSAVMNSRAYTFSVLEELVALFLQKSSAFWVNIRRPRVAGAGVDSVAMAVASESGDSDSVQNMLAQIREKQRNASAAAGLPSLDDWFQQLDETMRNPDYMDLLFEMHYVTDELVYFALRHGPSTALRIATMLFSFIFKQSVFSTSLQADHVSAIARRLIAPWAGQLRYFLSYFPDKAGDFKDLLALDKRVSQRIGSEGTSGRLTFGSELPPQYPTPSPPAQ